MLSDHVEQLEISEEEAARHPNELRSLERLTTGLNHLHVQVSAMEGSIRQALPEDRVMHIFGNAPMLEGIPQDLVACFFHWYSVTACSYVQLAGWLGNGEDTEKAKNYLQKVLPEVSMWRNKVGAHFALVDPKETGVNKDSAADLAKSVMPPIAFLDDAFYTDSFVLKVASGEPQKPRPPGVAEWRWRLLGMSGRHAETSTHQMRWSLTKTHRNCVVGTGLNTLQKKCSRHQPGDRPGDAGARS